MKRVERNYQITKQYYPTMSSAEIELRFGIKRDTVGKIARKLGISHTEETKQRLYKEKLQRLKKACNSYDRAKTIKTRNAKRKMDMFRMWNGQKRETNYLMAELPKKTYQARHYLVRRYGYCISPDDPYTLEVTGSTKRCKKEQYYTDKYRLKFKENEGI